MWFPGEQNEDKAISASTAEAVVVPLSVPAERSNAIVKLSYAVCSVKLDEAKSRFVGARFPIAQM